MAAQWPTHVVKARKVKTSALYRKKHNRRQRRLFKGGKRGPLDG